MSLRFTATFLIVAFAHLVNAQCVSVPACPASTDTSLICSYLYNSTELWNNSLFNGHVTGSFDLFEGQPEITATAVNTPNCPGPTSVAFEIYLDLDGNNIPETVLLSSSQPESGSIRFDNLSDPVNGGTLVAFDNRPVVVDDKYRFAVETVVSGNSVTARLRFNTTNNPNTFIDPFLPGGRHKIKFIFTDPGGSSTSCVQNIHITDCKKPTVVCLNGISINLMPFTPPSVTLWVSDFLQYGEDNVTNGAELIYAVRESGTGTGFPGSTSITFDCSQLGTRFLEVWAMDQHGNADYCELYINVMDNLGFCATSPEASMSFCVKNWCDGAAISGVDTAYVFNNQDPSITITDPSNCSDVYTLPNSGILGALMVKKDDMLNGLSVSDALKIALHVVGVDPLNYPYGHIAADVNNSQNVSIIDAVTLLRLLAGLPVSPIRDSWTIVDSSSVSLTTGGNPFALSTVWYAPNPVSTHLNVPFTAIKTGDLDCTALPGLVGDVTEDRDVTALLLPDAVLQAGESIEVPLTFVNDGQWSGLQLGLRFDPALLSITGYTSPLDDNEFGVINTNQPGALNMVWFNTDALQFPAGSEVVRLQLTALAPVQLKQAISMTDYTNDLFSAGYDAAFNEQYLTLDFTTAAAAPAKAFGVKSPAPNPVGNGGTMISVSTDHAQAVTLSLFDISGRQCFVQNGVINPGENYLTIPATAFQAGSGVYVWRVTTNSGSAEGKVVK